MINFPLISISILENSSIESHKFTASIQLVVTLPLKQNLEVLTKRAAWDLDIFSSY